MSAEQKRLLHQKSLLEQRRLDSLQRFADNTPLAQSAGPVFRRYESYKKDTMLPREIRSNKILVDRKNSTIILPVFGLAVPFHINSLKNIQKNDENEYVYLRFNFNTPGQATKKDEVLPYDDASANFVRSLTFRSTDTWRYNQLYKDIMELKRDIQKKELQRKEMEDLVEQAKLEDGKRPLAILTDVHIRPALEGKKVAGDLQMFKNGLRYSPLRGDQKVGKCLLFGNAIDIDPVVDIIYSNIRHCFFQPCDQELYVILHFHLKNPIMVGKKKTLVILVKT
jgi:nucleosome binding factor SPN SPT16 subunit